jgi:hypothetical protein
MVRPSTFLEATTARLKTNRALPSAALRKSEEVDTEIIEATVLTERVLTGVTSKVIHIFLALSCS